MKLVQEIVVSVVCSSLLCLANPAVAQQWMRFRGPNGTGVSPAQGIPSRFSLADAQWRVPLRGAGHSSPVVWSGRVFVTGFDEGKQRFMVQCLSTEDGSELWSYGVPQESYPTHQFNHLASSTPVTDGEHLVVISSEPSAHMVLAFNMEGNVLWTRRFETSISNHGGGVSPIIFDGRVILAADEDGESFLSALDITSGDVLWRIDRYDAKASFATPCEFVDPSGTRGLLFSSMAHGISFVDPNNGKTLWEQDGLFDKRTISSSLVVDGLVVGTCGSGLGGNYLVALNPGSAQQRILPSLAYKLERSIPYVPTSVAQGKLFFLWGDSGILTCVKAGNGETIWRERVKGRFFGSPVWVEDRLFCISTEGQVVVVAASEKFEQLAVNDLEEPSHATPAVANNCLYLRTLSHLVSIGARATR